MSGWPPRDQDGVYVPARIPAPAVSDIDQRAELAAARIRDGLPADDRRLDEIMLRRASDPQAGIYTAAERKDIYGDSDWVAARPCAACRC